MYGKPLVRTWNKIKYMRRGGWEGGPNEDRVNGHERAHVLQLLLQEEDLSLSLSLSLRDGMGWSQSSTHTYTQTYMEWAAADCLGEGGMEGEDKCMYVRTAGEPAWEELQKRST